MAIAARQTLATPEETHRAGVRVAEHLAAGAVIALVGAVGAGKTCFAQGIVAGLGSKQSVRSPTFGLVHEYLDGRLPVYHLDLYRVEGSAELLDLGWDDYLEGDGVVLVEWADRFSEFLPEHAQWWRLHHDEETGGRVLERLP